MVERHFSTVSWLDLRALAEGLYPERVLSVTNPTNAVRGTTLVSWSPERSRILTEAYHGSMRAWRASPPTMSINETMNTDVQSITHHNHPTILSSRPGEN